MIETWPGMHRVLLMVDGDFETISVMSPDEARALGRKLLREADIAERGIVNG